MTNGRKYDKGKLRFSLLPQQALWGIIEVLEHGAAKYAVNNWVHVPDSCTRYFDAMHRHLAAMERGEATDPDSGLPHAWHMCCSAIIGACQYMTNDEARQAWVGRLSAAPEPVDASALVYVGPPEGAPPGQLDLPIELSPEQHTHIWELVHADTLKSWQCSCGASVHETSNGRYARRDAKGDFQGNHATYFQATHVP